MSKVLTKEFDWLVAEQVEVDQELVWQFKTDLLPTAGWNSGWIQPTADVGFFYNETYFDLAGLSMREKTLFFNGATTQDLRNPIVFQQAAGDSLTIMDVLTSSPMNSSQILAYSIYGNYASGSQSAPSFDQTIYSRLREYVIDIDTQAWGSFRLFADHQHGSLSSTASDRIYVYRMVFVGTPFVGNRIDIPPVRYVLSADAKTEDEYQYLMRLARSYELQNQPDIDVI